MPSLVAIINRELYIFQSGDPQISWLGKGFPIRNLIIRFLFVKKKLLWIWDHMLEERLALAFCVCAGLNACMPHHFQSGVGLSGSLDAAAA